MIEESHRGADGLPLVVRETARSLRPRTPVRARQAYIRIGGRHERGGGDPLPGAQSQNAMVSGIIIAVLSVAALAAFAEWEEWLNLVVGLWVLVSPWVLDFANTAAMWVHIVIGIIVAVVAAIEVWMMRHGGRLMASR
jgi:SPW repeat